MTLTLVAILLIICVLAIVVGVVLVVFRNETRLVEVAVVVPLHTMVMVALAFVVDLDFVEPNSTSLSHIIVSSATAIAHHT